MYNKVILVGRLTRDVELRYLPSGSSVAGFALATSRSWRDKNSGEQKEETMFIDISVFGRSAEIANQYLRKGNRVLVEGRLVLEQWQDQNGQNRSKHKIVADSVNFMETKAEAQSSGVGGNTNPNPAAENRSNPSSTPSNTPPVKEEKIPEIDVDDDDIPF